MTIPLSASTAARAAGVVLAAALVAALLTVPPVQLAAEGAAAASTSSMSLPQAVLLGLVEGVTEFLPVSSTGHLTVVQSLLGPWATPEEKSASDAYAICIQAGATIAVLLVSWRRILSMLRGMVGVDPEGLRLAGNLVVAFVPAAALGLLLEAPIKRYLFGVWPVAAAWLVGGVFILLIFGRRSGTDGRGIEGLTWKAALLIGVAQAAALWPGVSRSLVTIAGGLLAGLSLSAAVEWSFLLGLVTLGAATAYEAIAAGPEIVRTFGAVSPVVGMAVAAASAFLAVRWMVAYVKTRGLAVFGWYRIGAAVLTAALVLTGLLAS